MNKITYRKWIENDLKLVEEFLMAGKSKEFISSHFKTSIENIRQIMSRNNLKTFRPENKHPPKKKKTEDLSTRIRILKGEEIRISDAYCFFSDEELHRWKDNTVECCDRFCKDVLEIELQSYQLTCIDKMLKHKRFVGVLGRQSGKDFLLSCFVVWQSVINSNSKILLVSASQRASDLLYTRILNFIGSSNELFDSVDKSNMERCVLKNNSEVWSLPASGQIRGQTEVTHVIVNEAHEVADETFSAVEPMLAVKHGFLYLFSTPKGCIGRLWQAFNDPLFAKIQLPSTVNKYIPKAYFELQQKTMDSLEYDMEINAQFQESVDAFFPLSVINGCSEEYTLRQTPEKEKDYYAGIDWGRIADKSVVTILSKKKIGEDEIEYKVENIVEMEKTPFPEQQRRILELHSRYKFRKIAPEYNGLGMPSCDFLKEKLGDVVKIFQSTLDSKAESFNNLRKTMEDRTIVLPKTHIKLQYELRTFQYRLTQTGKMKLFHLSNSSDDFVDSLSFSIFAAEASKIIFDFGDGIVF